MELNRCLLNDSITITIIITTIIIIIIKHDTFATMVCTGCELCDRNCTWECLGLKFQITNLCGAVCPIEPAFTLPTCQTLSLTPLASLTHGLTVTADIASQHNNAKMMSDIVGSQCWQLVLLRIPNPQPNLLPESVRVRIRESFAAVVTVLGRLLASQYLLIRWRCSSDVA